MEWIVGIAIVGASVFLLKLFDRGAGRGTEAGAGWYRARSCKLG